jgi:hypothetical protein
LDDRNFVSLLLQAIRKWNGWWSWSPRSGGWLQNAMSLPARLCLNLRHNTHQSAQRLPFFKNPLHHNSGLHTTTSITSLPSQTQPCKPSRTISIGPVGDKPEASHPLSRAPKKAHHTPANISISCLSRVATAKCNPPTQDQEWKYKAETDDNESNGDVWRESHFMLISRFVSFRFVVLTLDRAICLKKESVGSVY